MTRRFRTTRRDFLAISSSALAGLVFAPAPGGRRQAAARFGLITDPHYADCEARGTRFYAESTAKMSECVDFMNGETVDFLIELGDFKDQDEPAVEADTLRYLDEIEAVFADFDGPRYHVLGNHDMDSISKAQFAGRTEDTGIEPGRTYYSFDVGDRPAGGRGGLHCVVLDANFRADGAPYDHGDFDYRDTNIPPEQLDWLAQDLAATDAPTLLFCHQRLDGEGPLFVNNADEVRSLLRRRGNVVAAFHGHDHAGGHTELDGVHYYTLIAMVEGSGPEASSYAIVEVLSDGLQITGYRRALPLRTSEPVRSRATRAQPLRT